MLLFLFSYIAELFSMRIPSAFYDSSTRMMLAALTSLGFVLFFGPFFIKKLYELKTGQSIRVEDCPALAQLHAKKKDTPTMGGILLLVSLLVSLLLWMDLCSVFTLILFLTTLCFGGLGAYDDYLKLKFKNSKGISAKKKFSLQCIFAAGLALYLLCPSIQVQKGPASEGKYFSAPSAKEQCLLAEGKEGETSLSLAEYSTHYFVPFYKEPIFVLSGGGLLLAFLCTLFVVIGSSNAVNLTDGLDGLASGCLMMVAVVMAIFAFLSNNLELSRYLHILYIEGSGEIAIYLCALAGACLGFLWFNGSPAQVFMGDTGSLSLGAILGVCAVLLRREVLLGLIGGVFVLEAVSVILQVASYRLRNKKRIFLCAPLHHHFEYKGWPETKVVIRFWIISLLLCLLGIMSLKLQ